MDDAALAALLQYEEYSDRIMSPRGRAGDEKEEPEVEIVSVPSSGRPPVTSRPSSPDLLYISSDDDGLPVAAVGGGGLVADEDELLDPTPDVRSLFVEYDKMFFESKLGSVEVKWSPRMTLCAGVCSYQGKHGLCSM